MDLMLVGKGQEDGLCLSDKLTAFFKLRAECAWLVSVPGGVMWA